MSPSWRNILLITGATVGAGIFSLPHALRETGVVPFLVLLALAGYICFRLNYFLMAVIREVTGTHQLSGYIEKVLGAGWGRISLFLHIFSTFGALIAYTIIGGTFLGTFFGIPQSLGSQLFFLLAGSVIFFAGKKIASFDMLFSVVKFIMFILVVIAAMSLPASNHFEAIPAFESFPLKYIGVFLFASAGFTIIPELIREKGKRSHSLLTAQVLITVLYLVFGVALYGFVNGSGYLFPTPTATAVFTITGFVSVFTAYLILAWVCKDTLEEDLRLNTKLATGLTIGVPFLAVVSQFGTFIGVLGFTGGVFLSGTGILLCRSYRVLYPDKYVYENYFVQLFLGATIVLELLRVAGLR
ncbi:MAG: hypothetical protein N2691_02545 [Patescibacteria group bacterium]|nr:hypothetical protein [Patescibacteria group bacterium]